MLFCYYLAMYRGFVVRKLSVPPHPPLAEHDGGDGGGQIQSHLPKVQGISPEARGGPIQRVKKIWNDNPVQQRLTIEGIFFRIEDDPT